MLNLDDVSLPDGVQQMKLNQSRTKLRDAEMELRMLEDDAHREDVPPGWIRCEFE
jgi:hypothetical protein